ncbi:MAG: haloacid dehalogenase-like hydrolase, partial [Planctomycetota bacterium]
EIKDGKYTGNIKGLVSYGIYKIERIKEFIEENGFSLAGSWVYTDHISDLQLLEMADNKCVVNPDKKLKRLAEKRGWKLYIF